MTDTVAILRGLREQYEEHHSVAIDDTALEAAARLSERYITDNRLPDKALENTHPCVASHFSTASRTRVATSSIEPTPSRTTQRAGSSAANCR